MNKNPVINFGLNPSFKTTVKTDIVVWSHDSESYVIEFNFSDYLCNKPFDLTDSLNRIMLEFLNSEEAEPQIYKLEIDSNKLGIATFTIPENILGYVGKVKASITIDFKDKTHDLGNFVFDMKKSSIDQKLPQLTFYVDEFSKALEKFDELEEKIERNDLVTHPDFQEAIGKTASKKEVEALKKEVDTKATKQEVYTKAEQATVNQQVSELEKEISNIARGMIGSFTSVAELTKAYPNGEKGFALVDIDTDVNGQMMKVPHTFTWDGSKWLDRGPFNGMEVPENSVKHSNIIKNGVFPSNIATNSISNVIKWDDLETGRYSAEKNKKINKVNDTEKWMRSKSFYLVSEGDVVQFNMAFKDAYFIGCNDNDIVLQLSENMDNAGFKEVIVEKGVTRLYTNYFASFKNKSMISINDLIPNSYKETDGKIVVNWITLDEDSVTEEMLKNNSLGKEKFKEKSLDQTVFADKSLGTEVIKDKAITPELIVSRYSNNAIVKDDLSLGYYTNVVGEKVERKKLAVINWYSPNYYFEVSEGDVIGFNEAYKNTYFVGTDESGTILQVGDNVDTVKETYITVVKNVTRLYVSIYKDYKNSFMMSINTKVPKIYTDFTPKIKIDWLDLQLEEFLSKWVGKKCVWYGDSISWQDGNVYNGTSVVAKGYQSWVKEELGFKEIDNLAISGKPMANGTANGDGIVMTIISTKSSSDLVVIAAGTNDFKLNVHLGEIKSLANNNDYDDATFYGAYQKALDKLMKEKGVNKIILMTPLQRDNAGYDVNKVNSAGHKLIDYVNAIKKIGELYSVPVWDGYSLSGLNFFNLGEYTLDGLHPNNAGYEFISKSQVKFIDSVNPLN